MRSDVIACFIPVYRLYQRRPAHHSGGYAERTQGYPSILPWSFKEQEDGPRGGKPIVLE